MTSKKPARKKAAKKTPAKRSTLTWREGRATPDVGGRKGAGGKVTATRKATANEQKQINKGRWVTTRPPGQSNKKSSVRPALAKKQKNPKTADGRKSKAGGKPR